MAVNNEAFKDVQYFIDDIASGVWDLKEHHWELISKNAHSELDRKYGFEIVEQCLLAYKS